MRRVAVAVLIVAVVLVAVAPPPRRAASAWRSAWSRSLASPESGPAATAPPVVYAAPAYYAPTACSVRRSYPGGYAPARAYRPRTITTTYYPATYYRGYYAAYPARVTAAARSPSGPGPAWSSTLTAATSCAGDGVARPGRGSGSRTGRGRAVRTDPDGPEGAGQDRRSRGPASGPADVRRRETPSSRGPDATVEPVVAEESGASGRARASRRLTACTPPSCRGPPTGHIAKRGEQVEPLRRAPGAGPVARRAIA